MERRRATIDATELDLAATQVDEIALANKSMSSEEWKAAIVNWHTQTLATARAEAWIPGMAGKQDPVVEEALSRYYHHHVRTAVKRLNAEKASLRRKLVLALECVEFYASSPSDGGARAKAALRTLSNAQRPRAMSQMP